MTASKAIKNFNQAACKGTERKPESESEMFENQQVKVMSIWKWKWNDTQQGDQELRAARKCIERKPESESEMVKNYKVKVKLWQPEWNTTE